MSVSIHDGGSSLPDTCSHACSIVFLVLDSAARCLASACRHNFCLDAGWGTACSLRSAAMLTWHGVSHVKVSPTSNA
eukprot:scaffold313071_cov35-Tisochrysis_lutea.AAC.1